MKKTIIALAVGSAAICLTNVSFGQGQVAFCNYANGGALTAPVTISGSGLACGPSYTADLLYSFNGTSYTDSGFTAGFLGTADGDTANGAGFFGNQTLYATIPGYSSGNVWFEVQVYNGSSYASSTIRGISAPVELNNLATAANSLPPGSLLSDNTAAVSPLQAFTVSAVPVPEPGTLALAGLGGLGMLLAFRRKKINA